MNRSRIVVSALAVLMIISSSFTSAGAIFPIAATRGTGVEAWAEWLASRIEAAKASAAG